MKALTLWQPWATLIVNGDKHIETRGHKTNIRGRVAIHAAKVNKVKLFLSLPMIIKEYFYKSGIRLVDVLPRGKEVKLWLWYVSAERGSVTVA